MTLWNGVLVELQLLSLALMQSPVPKYATLTKYENWNQIIITIFKQAKISVNKRKHCTKNEVYHKGYHQQIWPNPQFPTNLVVFTEEILYEKIHFFVPWKFRFCWIRYSKNLHKKQSRIWTFRAVGDERINTIFSYNSYAHIYCKT